MQTDAELLRRYVRNGDEAAFHALVERHLHLVYVAASREAAGDGTLAEEVTQLVFIELARRAGRLTQHPALAGWLYQTVRFVSANVRRAQHRRIERERKAFIMDSPPLSQMPGPSTEQFDELLNDALHELDDKARSAVLLRFFKGQTLQEVGAAIGVSENAARMQV